jgi:hypothetical protein
MHGIVTLLPEPYYSQVIAIWDELSERHGLTGIRVTPYPHFSWQIGQHYPSPQLEDTLRSIAVETSVQRVSTAGLGIFTGPSPVLYIPVVKTSALISLHHKIWERFSTFGVGISTYYNPTAWVPHISLAYLDLTPANIGLVLHDIVDRNFTWDMRIDNIAYIDEPNGSVGNLKMRFDFDLIGS